MLSQPTRLRLETQLDVLPLLLADTPLGAVTARPASGQWSAHEHLAHLARHHSVFLERVRCILRENRPDLGRYRAEEDASWPEWACLSTDEVLHRLGALRTEIRQLVTGLSEADIDRIGGHPLFGAMSIALWVEFFLLHEAHHLYMIMTRLGQAKRTLRS